MTKLAFVLENGRELRVPMAGDAPLGRLAELTAAVKDAEDLHQEHLQSLQMLTKDRDRMQTEVHALGNQQQALASNVKHLEARLAESKQELEALRSRQDQGLASFQEIAGKRAIEEAAFVALEKRLGALREQAVKDEKAASLAEGRRGESERLLVSLNEKLAGKTAELEDLTGRLKTRRDELVETERCLLSRQSENKEAAAQRGRLEREMDQLRELISRRDTHRIALEKQAQELDAKILTATKKLTEIDQRLQNSTQAMETVTRQLASTREQQQNAAQSLVETQADLSRFRAESATARDQLAAEQKALAETLDTAVQARSRLDGLRADSAAQEQKLAQLIADVARVSGEEQTLCAKHETTAAALAEVTQRLETARQQHAETTTALTTAERTLATTREQLAAETKTLEETQVKSREAAERLDLLRADADEQEKRFAKLHQQMEALRREHGQLMDESHAATRTLVETTRSIETAREQQSEAIISLDKTAHELQALQARRDTAAGECAGEEQRLATLREALAGTEAAHASLCQQIEQQREEISSMQKVREDLLRQEEDSRAALDTLGARISETKASLEALHQEEQAQQQRLAELNQTVAEAEKQHAERQQALESEAVETRQKVDELENRATALEEWQQRMQDCHKRLADMPPETLEARNLRNEIEMAMASMRHLLSNRSRVVAFPPPLAGKAPVPVAPTPAVGPATVYEARAGRITGAFSMPDKVLREQDRRIEDKIRVNEARLELLEARLRRGEEDERCHREKIAMLKQQLAALAQGGR